MTALEEIKESTKDSLAAKQRTLSELIEDPENENFEDEVRDASLDIIGEALAMYKVTVGQARIAESVDEVAGLWKDTHAFYASLLTLWQGLDALSGEPSQDKLFAYCRQAIEKHERASAQAYEFHA